MTILSAIFTTLTYLPVLIPAVVLVGVAVYLMITDRREKTSCSE